MTNHIQQIMKNVGFHVAQSNPEVTLKEVEFLCESLVKECAKFAKRYTSDETNTEHYEEVGWECLPLDLQYAMLEYFGVQK